MQIEIVARVRYPGVDISRVVGVTINGELEDARIHAATYFRGHIADQLEVEVLKVVEVEDA